MHSFDHEDEIAIEPFTNESISSIQSYSNNMQNPLTDKEMIYSEQTPEKNMYDINVSLVNCAKLVECNEFTNQGRC